MVDLLNCDSIADRVGKELFLLLERPDRRTIKTSMGPKSRTGFARTVAQVLLNTLQREVD